MAKIKNLKPEETAPETTAPEETPKTEEIQSNNMVELKPGQTVVDERLLNQIIEQNATLKNEVGTLVGVFKQFSGLFKGGNVLSLTSTIAKMINNPKIAESLKDVYPIIDKYSHE